MAFTKGKSNKILVWVLGLVLAGIWGEVGYRLIWGEGSDDASQQESANVLAKTNRMEEAYSFDPNVRDPFSYHNEETEPVKKIVRPAIKIWLPPQLKLKGVISRGKKRTAVIEAPDGTTYFMAPGDTLYGVTILAVSNELVKYRYEKKDTGWSVGR
jgi:hypothetical protein